MKKEIEKIAKKYEVSVGAIMMLVSGLQSTNGNQVQFNHPDLGGLGQWQLGMVMIGDMFNHTLKMKINEICQELALLVRNEKINPPKKSVIQNFDSIHGKPAFKGSQNNLHYAYYPEKNLFILEQYGIVEKYNTEGYQIVGLSQQQSNFTQDIQLQTDKGSITIANLPKL
ncbi:MAG: hypothetical protein MUE81_13260 [Thermoflexibacter sp.]|jgi:hypothetical protein|nr:hypothetical protein [Thermoflexibacter sp.]